MATTTKRKSSSSTRHEANGAIPKEKKNRRLSEPAFYVTFEELTIVKLMRCKAPCIFYFSSEYSTPMIFRVRVGSAGTYARASSEEGGVEYAVPWNSIYWRWWRGVVVEPLFISICNSPEEMTQKILDTRLARLPSTAYMLTVSRSIFCRLALWWCTDRDEKQSLDLRGVAWRSRGW